MTAPGHAGVDEEALKHGITEWLDGFYRAMRYRQKNVMYEAFAKEVGKHKSSAAQRFSDWARGERVPTAKEAEALQNLITTALSQRKERGDKTALEAISPTQFQEMCSTLRQLKQTKR